MAAEHGNDPFHHVRDTGYFELPGHYIIPLPELDLFGYHFQITKFMVLQLVAGLLTLLIFWDLSRRIKGGKPARGTWYNFWEMTAYYLRDNVVRPTIGAGHAAHGANHGHAAEQPSDSHGHAHHHSLIAADVDVSHPADRFCPFIWTCFYYILFCNLLGAVPWLGSPTGNINVTGAMAIMAFAVTVISGSIEFGILGFWKNLVPPLDAPPWMKIALIPMMFIIEILGLVIKHSVLAVRLFANIMGGHTVIGVMLGFLAAKGITGTLLWWLVMPASILGQVGIGLLELFVAFLQAYVFAFLATIFIAMGSQSH